MDIAVRLTSESARMELARRFHALSDATRLAILDSLRAGECCVCDLQSSLDVAQSRLSFHRRVLKEAGLITQRKDGRWSWYELSASGMADVSAAVEGFRPRNHPHPLRYPLPHAVTGSVVRDDSVEADASGCCG